MYSNPIFDAAIEELHRRQESVRSAMDDFVKHDHIEGVAKRIYTEQMGLCELIEYLRSEFGVNYQTMQEQIQDVR